MWLMAYPSSLLEPLSCLVMFLDGDRVLMRGTDEGVLLDGAMSGRAGRVWLAKDMFSRYELDEAVEMLIQRALPQEHQEKICQRLGDGRGVLMQLITPNYVLVSYPMGDDDVRDAQYLRHLFRMVLISRLFVASVVLKEVSYVPLKETVSKGVAYLSTSLGLAKTLEHLGVHLRDGWVSIEDVDSVLKRLSCVLQLASLISMSQPKTKEKRGLLLDIINNPAGRTLNELSLLVGNKGTSSLKRAITLFNMLKGCEHMRPVYWTEEEEEADEQQITQALEETIEHLSEYLKTYRPKSTGYTKSSIMGPVGKLLSAVSSKKIENADALVGYVVSIHNNTSDWKLTKEGNEQLKAGVKALMRLQSIVPKRMWMKTIRELDYAVYKNKLEYILTRGETDENR